MLLQFFLFNGMINLIEIFTKKMIFFIEFYLEKGMDFIMKQPEFDFYDKTSLKSYNLDKSMRYQLDMLDTLDVFTRKHCENVAALTCRLCE